MIFAAGLGTRLRPLTDSLPKALIPVGGKTMLERVILKLRDAGIERMVINVHHHAEKIRDFLAMHNNFGVYISISDETAMLLDTGGGVAAAAPLLLDGVDEPVLIHNADILTDFPLADMMADFGLSDRDASLLIADRKSSRALLFDGDGRMRGWCRTDGSEIRPAELVADGLDQYAFGGVHIISPRVIEALVEYAAVNRNVFSITDFYIDTCKDFNYIGWHPAGRFAWFDIGRPATLEAARMWADSADAVNH